MESKITPGGFDRPTERILAAKGCIFYYFSSTAMRVNSSLVTTLGALAYALPNAAASCSETARFGVLRSQRRHSRPAMRQFSAHVGLQSVSNLGYLPTYMDYYVEVLSNNNGIPQPTHSLLNSRAGITYFADALYWVVFVNSFAKNGPNNSSVIATGSISSPTKTTGI
ncbi:hypothetical protein B0H10DRAFT_2206802 [Mycena sp. CBHHK59/15]|nr:hypothetical protein B0H10DRAFT_2206802 [Mycena sp. CBHHK59/15]